jgi:hypothetical protein
MEGNMEQESNPKFSLAKIIGNKLVLGGMAAAITAMISVGGISFASALSSSSIPPNENACMQHYGEYHFKGRQQCIDWWNQHHGGSGYGGSAPVHPTPPHGHHFHFHFGSFGNFYHRFSRHF